MDYEQVPKSEFFSSARAQVGSASWTEHNGGDGDGDRGGDGHGDGDDGGGRVDVTFSLFNQNIHDSGDKEVHLKIPVKATDGKVSPSLIGQGVVVDHIWSSSSSWIQKRRS